MSEWTPERAEAFRRECQAPAGQIWICGACGKMSKDRANGPRWWDESCFLNAYLIPEPPPPEMP